MGICYLVNPLHQQINSVFHNVSHALEIPDYIMSHDSNYEHESYGHTDYQIGNLNHDHEIVDFIDSVFDASDEDGGSEDSMLTEIKIDKHITTYQFQFQNNFNIAIFQNFWFEIFFSKYFFRFNFFILQRMFIKSNYYIIETWSKVLNADSFEEEISHTIIFCYISSPNKKFVLHSFR